MKIAVIGSGRMGSGFAKRLAGKHEVFIGSREPEKGSTIAKEVGAAGGGSYADVVDGAEVVLITVPWTAVDETLRQLGDLSDAVVVDVTNPYVGGKPQFHENSSNAEEIQKKLPRARVVKGWNLVFSPVLDAGPDFDGQAASVFLAGDDTKAKKTVASLARDMGFEPVDCGPLTAARDLERLLGFFGTLGHEFGWGTWALRILHR